MLITIGGLRADVVGAESLEPSWAPHLSGWDLGWRGTAVTASSEPVVALTSLLTGARPWQHQRLRDQRPRGQRPRGQRLQYQQTWSADPGRLPSLAKALGRVGYRSHAYIPAYLHALGDDFDQVDGPLSPQKAPRVLGEISDGELLWIHLVEADLGWRRRKGGRGRYLERQRLLKYTNPQTPLPEAERRALWKTYQEKIRRLDNRIGEFVDLLRRGPAWDRLTLLITGSHGCELGEHGQMLQGENLGRESLEVPLLARWPKEFGPVAEPRGAVVAQTRLWATVAEIVGLEPVPALPPSLLRGSPSPSEPRPILSELYGVNGVNRFSLVSDGYQLHWTTRFSADEPEYYAARRVQKGARAKILSEPMGRIFGRLNKAFLQSPPLSGPSDEKPDLAIERWVARGATEPVDDPDKAREMALVLKRQWLRFAGRERTPEEERKTRQDPSRNGLTPSQPAG